MNTILELVFNQWHKNRIDGKAETIAHDHFSNTAIYSVEIANRNSELFCEAMHEVERRAFLTGFNTAVELKNLLDGKTTDDVVTDFD